MSWIKARWKWFAGAACGAVAVVTQDPALAGACAATFGVAAVEDGRHIAELVRGLITGRKAPPK